MKNRRTGILVSIFLWSARLLLAAPDCQVSGELKVWHKVTLTFALESTSQTAAANPFAGFRLDVTFRQNGLSMIAPGYYAADGNATQSSAGSGNQWRVHFMPPRPGLWNWSATFARGANAALADRPSGETIATGRLDIRPSDKSQPDFRGRGRLAYVGKRYPQFQGTDDYFLKGGADSPENFLDYADFDGTFDTQKKQSPEPDPAATASASRRRTLATTG